MTAHKKSYTVMVQITIWAYSKTQAETTLRQAEQRLNENVNIIGTEHGPVARNP